MNLSRIFFELGPEQSRARSVWRRLSGGFDSGFAESACPIRRGLMQVFCFQFFTYKEGFDFAFS